ncbi:MAG TPA: nitrile hydratase subunit alpha, partial [Candidatus Handelsmanbacteria bacterium]|nr:nitrile hydratase subunit alpha [Candidatus Handelsmanbacteria bacterium]
MIEDPGVLTKALEALLVEKGLITSERIDELVKSYEEDIGPLRGAQVVARAWSDADYRKRLLEDGRSAVAEFGYIDPHGAELVAVENTEQVHNMVVCTLCSCYPWS